MKISRITLRAASIWLSCAVAATACFLQQELDKNAARGSPSRGTGSTVDTGPGAGGGGQEDAGSPTSTGGGGAGGGSTTGTGGDPCGTIRSQARAVLQTNCAFCHENPNNVKGNFDFILEPEKLKTRISSDGQRFVIPGDAD